jgi:hypothetical protein
VSPKRISSNDTDSLAVRLTGSTSRDNGGKAIHVEQLISVQVGMGSVRHFAALYE